MDSFPAIEIDKVKAWDFRLANINTSECLNVAYGVDANYLDGVGVSITSIVLNNQVPLWATGIPYKPHEWVAV